MNPSWYSVSNAADIPSPALLIYRERVDENFRRMIAMVGDPNRLRPHIKTHKLPELVKRQLELGITRLKCATIAEAEMAASSGAPDVLVASQPVGPGVRRLARIAKQFPQTQFSTTLDDADVIRALSRAADESGVRLGAWIDLDVGLHRTGAPPGPVALALVRQICDVPGLYFAGLHAYDGHIVEADPIRRAALCDAAFEPVTALMSQLDEAGLQAPALVVGGSPTFPMHARRAGVQCSPGTTVLWDAGYSHRFPDLKFLPAAVLLTRVISHPFPGRICVDLGHKAVASEMPPPRALFPDLPDAKFVSHSEEHLVLETSSADLLRTGHELYAIPWHVCPTVALHAEVWVVESGVAGTRWPVTARARRLSI